MSGPLPEGWSEGVDAQGRRFYSNHTTKSTTWDRPAAPAVSSAPPPYGSTPATLQVNYVQPRGQQEGGPVVCACTPRLTFWVASGVAWIVWAFAVSAGADDHWLDNKSFAAGDDDILDACDDDDDFVPSNNDDFCDLYRAFTAMQFVATIIMSISLVVLAIAFFRPAVSVCCSTRLLGIAGGLLVASFAFFQMLAFVLVVAIEKTQDDLGDFFSGEDVKLGATFGVAVVGFVIAMFVAGILVMFSRAAGDGPFYACVRDCMAMSNNSANTSRGGLAPPAPNAAVQSVPPPAAAPAPAQTAAAVPQPAGVPALPTAGSAPSTTVAA